MSLTIITDEGCSYKLQLSANLHNRLFPIFHRRGHNLCLPFPVITSESFQWKNTALKSTNNRAKKTVEWGVAEISSGVMIYRRDEDQCRKANNKARNIVQLRSVANTIEDVFGKEAMTDAALRARVGSRPD